MPSIDSPPLVDWRETEDVLTPWKVRAQALKAEGCALYLACRDPRVPRVAKLICAVVAAYALSPIDLIPDFIPVLGQLDDLILVPLGLALAARLIPAPVLREHRVRATELMARSRAR